jgi:hypothetical protein
MRHIVSPVAMRVRTKAGDVSVPHFCPEAHIFGKVMPVTREGFRCGYFQAFMRTDMQTG